MNARMLTTTEMMAPGRVLIKRKQLLQKVPLGERTILELERCGKFLRRFSITARSVTWDLGKVGAWIAQQQAAAVAQPAPGLKQP